MLKNPIPKVTNKFQYRAIGIVNGKFVPHDTEHHCFDRKATTSK